MTDKMKEMNKKIFGIKSCIEGAKDIQELVKQGNYSLKTGLKTVDQYMGIFRGEMVLVGGPPGAGKSTYVQQIALNAALRGDPVLVASYEVNHEDIGVNLICNMANIDTYIWRMKPLSKADQKLADDAIKKLKEIPLYIMDRRPTINDIRETIIRMDSKNRKPKLVIADYLNIMPKGLSDGRESIENNMADLIAIAKEFKIPVIAITALNREAIKREVKMFKLSDFRDSSNLEYGADKALFISSDVGEGVKKSRGNTMFLDLVKSRNGAPIVGQLKLKLFPHYHRVEDF